MSEDASTIRLWISTQDGSPRHLKGDDPDMQILLTIADINQPITIQATI